MIWTPTMSDIDKAADFAHAYIEKELKNRNDRYRFEGNHRLIQAVQGKLAEMAWASYFKADVDFQIRKKAVFDTDLTNVPQPYHVARMHVKTTVKDFYGNSRYDSWMVERNDPLVTKPDQYDWFLLSYVLPDFSVEMYGILGSHEIEWKETERLPRKLAVYRSDVDHLITKI